MSQFAIGVACFLACAVPTFASDSRPLSTDSLETPKSASVLIDSDATGTIYVAAGTYKLRIRDDGVSFQPILGVRAPRSPRLEIGLERVGSTDPGSEPLRSNSLRVDGLTVTRDFGSLVERFECGPTHVEHTFRIEQDLGDDPLKLTLGPTSEVGFRGRASDGLRFAVEGRGEIRYGDALVIDADGQRFEFPCEQENDSIVLRVSREILNACRFPIVIDPVVEYLAVATDTADEDHPDIAHDALSTRYLVVYERAVSASDRDIIARRYFANGTLLDEVAVDISDDDTVEPAVAASPLDFLVVWTRLGEVGGQAPGQDSSIRGRIRNAASTSQGSIFEISTGSSGEARPDVGGSGSASAFPYLVAWDELGPNLDRGVRARRVSETGSLSASIVIENAPAFDETRVRVSRTNSSTGMWLVVLDQSGGGLASRSLLAKVVPSDGGPTTASFLVATHASGEPFEASLDGAGQQWLVVHEQADPSLGGSRDLVAHRMFVSSSGQLASANEFSLSDLALGPAEFVDEFAPAVAVEGARFGIAFLANAPSTGVVEVHSTVILFAQEPTDPSLLLIQSASPITAGSQTDAQEVALASSQFASAGSLLAAWSRSTPMGGQDVEGAILSAVAANAGLFRVDTRCEEFGPILLSSFVPTPGEDFNIVPFGFSVPPILFSFGVPLAIPIPLCPNQGACALGVQPLLMEVITGVFTIPIPSDPSLIGQQLALQGIDLVPAAFTGVACGPPKYSQKFRTSETLVVTFQ